MINVEAELMSRTSRHIFGSHLSQWENIPIAALLPLRPRTVFEQESVQGIKAI
jgi:hypothetical protein